VRRLILELHSHGGAHALGTENKARPESVIGNGRDRKRVQEITQESGGPDLLGVKKEAYFLKTHPEQGSEYGSLVEVLDARSFGGGFNRELERGDRSRGIGRSYSNSFRRWRDCGYCSRSRPCRSGA
jgi:hypothetical protein